MLQIDPKLVYPLGSISLILAVLPVLILRKDLRKLAIISLIVFPFEIISEFMYFRDYWFPPDITNLNILGIRVTLGDVLFGIAAPLIMVLMYPFIFNVKVKLKAICYRSLAKKYFIVMFVITASWIIATFIFKINSIYTSSIAQLISSFVIILKRRDLIKVSLISWLLAGLGAFIFYFLFQLIIGTEYIKLVWLLDPANHGLYIRNVIIPLTEIFFASSMGAFFSIICPFLGKFYYKK